MGKSTHGNADSSSSLKVLQGNCGAPSLFNSCKATLYNFIIRSRCRWSFYQESSEVVKGWEAFRCYIDNHEQIRNTGNINDGRLQTGSKDKRNKFINVVVARKGTFLSSSSSSLHPITQITTLKFKAHNVYGSWFPFRVPFFYLLRTSGPFESATAPNLISWQKALRRRDTRMLKTLFFHINLNFIYHLLLYVATSFLIGNLMW